MSVHSPTKPVFLPAPPAPASASYAFLANPPKHKHKPQPIFVRCVPHTLSRPTSARRRTSGSGSPASFLTLVDTPTPTLDTPQTPHLTSHGYVAAFSTLHQRRGSIPGTPRSARRSPNSPKRGFPSGSPRRSSVSGSPKRRHHRTPSSPFAPPSPTRVQTRPRAKSTTRAPAPAPVPVPVPSVPKLSKIRSMTHLRQRAPTPTPSQTASPMPFSTTSNPKQSPKRSKRSATPARGSAAYAKYRPMPFIQQMQMIQFLEGGPLESHIRRHHVHAGQGTANTGFAVDQEVHGYAFTDERGMIWFDEEEEWEFACLLPRARPRRKQGIKRLWSRRREAESEEEWEDFAEAEECCEEDADPDMLLAREDDELRADQDDLAAFGGTLDGAWGRDRPERSVLKLPETKREHKGKRRRLLRQGTISIPPPVPGPAPTAALKQEFFSTAFAPSPARALLSPSPAPSLPARSTSPFRMFVHHRHARSVPATDAAEGQSFASVGTTLRGGAVLDGPTPPSPSPSQASTLVPPHEPISRQPSPVLRSVSPPPAAARRLGIDPATTVSLHANPIKKPSFMNLRWRRD